MTEEIKKKIEDEAKRQWALQDQFYEEYFIEGAHFALSLCQQQMQEKDKEIGDLKRLLGRDPNALYTYYQIDLKNINEEWDTKICESLEDVRKQLEYLDIHFDDDTPVPDGGERQVVITG